jgi:ADP-heptose:LPS heptosyltransferase
MAAAISAVDCFISADCGIMHLAVAADVTTIGFFSVTDPERYGPYGGLSRSIGTLGEHVDEVANRCVDVIEQICEGLPSERCPANLGDRSARRRQVS